MRAGHMLATLCRPWLAQIRNGLPVNTSLLTPGGYPLEFAFRSNSDDVCYTAEPGPPNSSPLEKWAFVRAIRADLDPQLHPLLRELVNQPAQRYGCWLGVRHHGDAASFKVYQEVTPQASDLVLRHLHREIPGLAQVNRLTPQLLGVSSKGGLAEFYCKVEYPGLGVMHELFAAAGVSKELPYVTNYLAYLAAEPSSKVLERLRIGISYSVSPVGPPGVTLFAHSTQLFPTNYVARMRLLGFASQTGAHIPLYERATRLFEEIEPPHIMHNLIGIKIVGSGRLEFAVGLRPFGCD